MSVSRPGCTPQRRANLPNQEDESSGLGLRCAIPNKQGGNLGPQIILEREADYGFTKPTQGVAPIERALALFDNLIEVSIAFRRHSSETV